MCTNFRLPVAALILTVVVSNLAGCATVQGISDYIAYNDCQNDFVLSWRNRGWANNAWHMRRAAFEGQPFIEHFGAGFRDGYADVASGSNGCTPVLPPRKYWNWKYQTPEGQGKTAAWFAGYPHGAKAAEEDGANLYSQIQVSQRLHDEYALGHQPPFNTPLFFHNPDEWCKEQEGYIGSETLPETEPMLPNQLNELQAPLNDPQPHPAGDPQASWTRPTFFPNAGPAFNQLPGFYAADAHVPGR